MWKLHTGSGESGKKIEIGVTGLEHVRGCYCSLARVGDSGTGWELLEVGLTAGGLP
jgi:hypothetical protein